MFRDLTELSGLPIHKTSSKFNKITKTSKPKPCDCTTSTMEYYNDPTELLSELEIIIDSLKSGNTSPLLFNKGIKIIDELIQKGFINQEQHENLFKNYQINLILHIINKGLQITGGILGSTAVLAIVPVVPVFVAAISLLFLLLLGL